MHYYSSREGITVGTTLIPYDRIHRIELDMEGESYFTTVDHETYSDKKLFVVLCHPDVYDAIRRYNIAFKDVYLRQFHEKTYKEEELMPLLEETMPVAKECADRYLQEHLGEEYAVDVKLDKDYEHYHLYFSLQRNGEILNLPHKMRISGGKKVPTSFEGMTLVELLEWDPSSKEGVYGVTEEVTDPEECRFLVESKMKDFCELYSRESGKLDRNEEGEKSREQATESHEPSGAGRIELRTKPQDTAAKALVRRKDHLLIRYSVFLVGLFIASMGVAISTVAELGTSPVASVPYSVSLVSTALTFGGWLNLLSVIQISVQVLLLKKKCDPLEIVVQTILAFVYGFLTNFSCSLLEDMLLVTYGEKLLFMFLGCAVLALGIWLQYKAEVAMLPGEAMNRAISEVTGKRYENVKIFFDICYIALAAVICLGFLHELKGVREGSIIAAVLVGVLIKFYNKIYDKVTKKGKHE